MTNTTYSTHLLRHFRYKIGENIHRMRAKQKMPMRKLAQATDVSIEHIDDYELGRNEIPFDHILKIACALGVEVEALLK